MNKRLDTLVRYARAYSVRDFGPQMAGGINLEKLAEMIVKDCIDYMNTKQNPRDMGYLEDSEVHGYLCKKLENIYKDE